MSAMKYGQQIGENVEHAIRVRARKQSGPTAHADTSERDRKQMEAIYRYPDFDSADRNKGSLQLGQ